jgi:hypothetical protein
MTDEGTGGGFGQPEEKPEAPLESAKSALGEMADFSSGEGLVAFAGILILAIWVIFDIFTDDTGFGTLTLLLAAVAVIVPRLDPETVAKAHPVPVVMKLAGYALGFIGVIDIVFVIETGFFDGYEAFETISALLTWVAFAMAFLGARSIKT